MPIEAVKRVAVVGAGMAGLTAAYRLGAAGHVVTVLETQSRIGGRALTLRSAVSDGLVAQAGPARFPDAFHRVVAFARQFDLELAPFYPNTGKFVALRQGVRHTDYAPSAEDFWAFPFAHEEGVRDRFAAPLVALRRFGRRLLGRPSSQTLRFRDGTDVLARALAAATPADVRLNATVHTIVQDSASSRVQFDTGTGPGTLEADYVVCAVPLSQLSALRFSPPIPRAQSELAAAIPFSSALRVVLEMRRAFWRDEGFNGFAITDSVGEIWDPHFDEFRTPALLVCYARDALADRLAALDEGGRVAHAMAEVERVFPGAAANFVRGMSFSWREQSWIRGGWPLVRDGYEQRVSLFQEPYGRVYFAGDYASEPSWLNTVEGAIDSGERAARAIAAG